MKIECPNEKRVWATLKELSPDTLFRVPKGFYGYKDYGGNCILFSNKAFILLNPDIYVEVLDKGDEIILTQE